MEQIKAFIEKAKSDSTLMAKLDALGKSGIGSDEVIALAAEYGFTFTVQEYEEAMKYGGNCAKCGELSEADLDAVSGGCLFGTQNRYDPDKCTGTLGRTKYECVGFLNMSWCDHFKMDLLTQGSNIFQFDCAMGAFSYKGHSGGAPI